MGVCRGHHRPLSPSPRRCVPPPRPHVSPMTQVAMRSRWSLLRELWSGSVARGARYVAARAGAAQDDRAEAVAARTALGPLVEAVPPSTGAAPIAPTCTAGASASSSSAASAAVATSAVSVAVGPMPPPPADGAGACTCGPDGRVPPPEGSAGGSSSPDDGSGTGLSDCDVDVDVQADVQVDVDGDVDGDVGGDLEPVMNIDVEVTGSGGAGGGSASARDSGAGLGGVGRGRKRPRVPM